MRLTEASRSAAKYFQYPAVDEDFDANEDFEAAVVDSIRRCGHIDIHPNGWGVHDGLGVNTDNMHYLTSIGLGLEVRARKPKLPSKVVTERKAALTKWEIRLQNEKQIFDRVHPLILAFPHSTKDIAWQVATEFSQVGEVSAAERGWTEHEWIWKRSRFMAGFK